MLTSNLGYCKDFFEASDGVVGLEIFKKNTSLIDIIITDIHMPRMNGFNMIKEILAIKPSQLFIVMTSYDTDENILESIHEGACNFLRKPINIKELLTFLLLISNKLQNSTKKISPTVSIDYRKELIFKNGVPIFLTNKCNKIFWLLAHNLGRLITYDVFEDCVYFGEEKQNSVLHVSMRRIRQDLGDVIIENVINAGYVLKSQ